MLLLHAIIIAIVEGITEFLPVSSTGHMIIVGDIINYKATAGEAFVEMFDVVIQLGAILAIVVLYWKKIMDSLKNFSEYGFKLWTSIIVAFIPSAVIGLLLHSAIKAKLFNSLTVAIALVVGGFMMIYFEKTYRKRAITKKIEDVNVKQAIKIGLFQCLALWPGMSRSASTIMGAWISGLSNAAAAEFSFFLALPTMVAASGLELIKTDFSAFNSSHYIALAVGFVVAFLVALIVVDKFIAFLKRKPMRIFAIYRIFIGIILIVLISTKVISYVQ